MPGVVEAVLFDVNETLFSLDGLRPRFAAVGLSPDLVPIWFTRVLRDGFALSLAGDFLPFAEVVADGLGALGADGAATSEVLAGFRELDVHPDVEPALRLVRDAGLPAMTLTVGEASLSRTLLARAGLSDLVTDCLSVEEVRRWKPAPEPYAYACGTLNLSSDRVALVSAHGWDVHGAGRAGLHTGWVSRLEGRLSPLWEPPDVRGDTLDEVVRRLLELPA